MANRIAVISSDFPAPNHPSYIFVEQLVNALVDSGVQITVIAPQSITRHLLRGVPRLPRVYRAKTSNGNEYQVFRPYYFSLGNTTGIVGKLVNFVRNRGIKKILKANSFDILYAHFWENAISIYKFASRHSLPLFVACGEGDQALEDLVSSLSDEKRQSLMETVNGVISVSSENRRKCIQYKLIGEDRIKVFPNCVNTKLFTPRPNIELKKELKIGKDDFTIAFVGGFIHRKGAKRLSEAISILNDRHIKSIFIGRPFASDSEEPECDGIVFKGPLNHDNIPDYLNCADVFVLPTLKEGCCNAIVEALSVGLPVISSIGSFNDDIIDSTNSIRVDPMDVDAIAAAIKKMKDDTEFKNKLKKNISENRAQYSIEGRASRILEFIDKNK